MPFTVITPEEISENIFKLIGKDWALVTAGNTEKSNTMTVSWGGAGIMWGKPVTYTFIRPQRYTMEFLQREDGFSMSFFEEDYRKALSFCGSKSGRDYDKAKETGLTTVFTEDGIPYFEEAKLVLICKKMYVQDLQGDCVIDNESVYKLYDNYYHKMFISEITKVLIK